MLQVIRPVELDRRVHGIRREPVGAAVAPAAAPEQRAMRRLVHQDRHAELTPADHEQRRRHDQRPEQRGRDRDGDHRRRDHAPGTRDAQRTTQVRDLAELANFIGGERIDPRARHRGQHSSPRIARPTGAYVEQTGGSGARPGSDRVAADVLGHLEPERA